MRVKIETREGHMWANDLPFIAVAMATDGLKAVERRLSEDFLNGLLSGMMVAFVVMMVAIFNAF